jgi:hypothetical protein
MALLSQILAASTVTGLPGRSPTLTLGDVTAVNPNVSPTITNTGTNGNAIFNFGIPNAPSLSFGSVTTLTPNINPSVSTTTTNGNVTFNLSIPRAPVITVNAATVVTPNTSPSISTVTTTGDPSITFSIPRAAAVSLNATPVVVVNPNVNPSVSTTTPNGDTVLQFSIPRASAISVGSVTTLEPLTAATVTNVGTNGDTVLNFSIPRGVRGVIPRGVWDLNTAYALDDLATYQGTTYRRLVAGTTAGLPAIDTTNWQVFAASGGGLPAQISYVVDNISNHFNGNRTLFNLNVNAASAGVTQAQDLMVVLNGMVLTPDNTTSNFSKLWLSVIPVGSNGADYKIINNQLLLYRPPARGWKSYILYTPTQTVVYATSQYPFTALEITLGD